MKWQPTPVFLPGKSHEERSLVGYSSWGHKESDTQQLGSPNLPIYHQQCRKVLFSPYPHQHLLSVVFFDDNSFSRWRWYLTVVLICISLIINEAEHLFICLLPICTPLEKGLLKCLTHFLTKLFVFLMLSCISYSHILDINTLLSIAFASVPHIQ